MASKKKGYSFFWVLLSFILLVHTCRLQAQVKKASASDTSSKVIDSRDELKEKSK